MAESVNFQQNEYDAILQKLTTLHTEELKQIRDILKEIQDTCSYEGGFYVEKISQKIENLLDSLEKNGLQILEKTFQTSEEGMGQFMRTIKYVDTMC